jgi:predicted nucleotidyltransferase
MKRNQSSLINNTINKLSKIKEIYAIFLFGSQINGRQREDSDIDIAVLTDKLTEKKELEIRGNSSELIDIVLFNKMPLIIQNRILSEGKILYCKNKDKLIRTKADTIKRYLDFSVFANRYFRSVIKYA